MVRTVSSPVDSNGKRIELMTPTIDSLAFDSMFDDIRSSVDNGGLNLLADVYTIDEIRHAHAEGPAFVTWVTDEAMQATQTNRIVYVGRRFLILDSDQMIRPSLIVSLWIGHLNQKEQLPETD